MHPRSAHLEHHSVHALFWDSTTRGAEIEAACAEKSHNANQCTGCSSGIAEGLAMIEAMYDYII